MNILVLMAGRGKRFTDAGYATPKPLLRVRGKTILEWTTESCPYIRHGGIGQAENIHLHFAVLQEHIDNGLKEFLYSVYGANITVIPFSEITRGNLDTAYLSCKHMIHKNEELLILDSDNKYYDNDFSTFLESLPKGKPTLAIAGFNVATPTVPNKWANVSVYCGVAVEIREKDDAWVKFPALIGLFYFSETDFFMKSANTILTTMLPTKGEYFMSMVPSTTKHTVYVHTVTDVVPLGTPEDANVFGTIEEDR